MSWDAAYDAMVSVGSLVVMAGAFTQYQVEHAEVQGYELRAHSLDPLGEDGTRGQDHEQGSDERDWIPSDTRAWLAAAIPSMRGWEIVTGGAMIVFCSSLKPWNDKLEEWHLWGWSTQHLAGAPLFFAAAIGAIALCPTVGAIISDGRFEGGARKAERDWRKYYGEGPLRRDAELEFRRTWQRRWHRIKQLRPRRRLSVESIIGRPNRDAMALPGSSAWDRDAPRQQPPTQ